MNEDKLKALVANKKCAILHQGGKGNIDVFVNDADDLFYEIDYKLTRALDDWLPTELGNNQENT